jgi:hypothetical protein
VRSCPKIIEPPFFNVSSKRVESVTKRKSRKEDEQRKEKE